MPLTLVLVAVSEIVGLDGGAVGVTAFEGADGGEVPT